RLRVAQNGKVVNGNDERAVRSGRRGPERRAVEHVEPRSGRLPTKEERVPDGVPVDGRRRARPGLREPHELDAVDGVERLDVPRGPGPRLVERGDVEADADHAAARA